MDQGTRGPETVMAEIVEKRGPGDQGTRGPATVMAEIVEKRGPGDQGTRGPETVMAEILILVDQGTRVPGDRRWLR